MATVVDELVVRISAQMDQYAAQLSTLQRTTDSRLRSVEQRFDRFGSTLRTSVSGAAMAASAALAGVGAGLGIGSLIEYADTWTRVTRSIEGTSAVYGIALAGGNEIAEMAIRTRSELTATSQLYQRTAVAVSRMGGDMALAARVTETFSQALKLGGANTSEQASAILQFSQALQKGKLDGDEFRSIMENAGVVQQALIEKFQASSATLFKMAETGKITSRDIVAAMEAARPKIEAAFRAAPVTVGEALTNLRTRLIQYVGSVDQASGVTGALGRSILTLSENLGTVARGAAVLAAVLLAAFAPAIVGGIVAAGVALGAAAATVGGVAVAAVGAATAVGVFADQIDLGTRGSASLYDVMTVIAGHAGGTFSAAMTSAGDTMTALSQRVQALFEGSGETIDSVIAGVVSGLNGFIGTMLATMDGLSAIILRVFSAIPAGIIDALNTGLAGIQSFARAAGELLNNLPGVEIDVSRIDVGQLTNAFAGSATTAEQIWQRASTRIGQDYIGAMLTAGATVRDSLIRDADAIAAKRDWTATVKITRDKPPVYADAAKADPRAAKFASELEGTRRKIAALTAEAAALGTTTAATERAKVAADLLADAKKSGIAITPQLTSQIDTLATAYGRATAQLELMRTIQSVRDDTAADQQKIQLVGLYGSELIKARTEMELLNAARRAGHELSPLDVAEIAAVAEKRAAVESLRDTLDTLRSTSQDALRGFISDIREGKSGTEALGGALDRIADKLIDMAANQLVDAAIGGLSSGLSGGGGASGFASLFAFSGGGVMTPRGPASLPRFARGGVSTSAAIFGEAGPEAAVPLPDGRRIPVELRMPDVGGAARSAVAASSPPVAVNVAPVFHLSGSVSAEDLARVRAEVLSAMPSTVQQGIKQAFDRDPRFRRSGV